MASRRRFDQLNEQIINCEACPRLREHCLKMATEKRASYRDWEYWGKPVPNFGDPKAKVLIVGLAPAAHGANRTGRMFTGDRSGDFLFARLHETGFANQPEAVAQGDGLKLRGVVITAAAHCAPPANKPTREEVNNCAPFLVETFAMLDQLKVVVCLGSIGLNAVLDFYIAQGWISKKSPYKFGHAAEHAIEGAPTILCSYHPSQQNTFTGKLTEPMLRDVFERAREIAKG